MIINILFFLLSALYGLNSNISEPGYFQIFLGISLITAMVILIVLKKQGPLLIAFMAGGLLTGLLASNTLPNSDESLPDVRGAIVELERTVTGFPEIIEPDGDILDEEYSYQVEAEDIDIISESAGELYPGQKITVRGRLYSYSYNDKARGTLYANDYQSTVLAEEILAEKGLILDAENLSGIEIRSEGFILFDWIGRARYAVSQKLMELSPDSRSVYFAFILGNREFLSYGHWKSFQMTGISHLLALSGLHIGVISFGLVFLLSLFMRKERAYLVSSIIVIFYIALAGFSPSLMRAGFMFILYNVLKASGRDPDFIEILLFSALVLLIIDPGLLNEAGFWLSYIATAGIVILAAPIRDFLKLRGQAGLALSATLAANMVTLPLIIYYFGGFSLVSPLTNVVISFFFAGIIVTVFISSFFLLFNLGFIFSFLEGIVDDLWWLTEKIADILSRPRWAYLETGNISAMGMLLFYLVFMFLFWGVPIIRYRNLRRNLQA